MRTVDKLGKFIENDQREAWIIREKLTFNFVVEMK